MTYSRRLSLTIVYILIALYFLGLVRLLKVTLLSRVTARSLQNNIVGYVPPSGHAISVLNHCLSWYKFVETHLYHSRQWFNIHIVVVRHVV